MKKNIVLFDMDGTLTEPRGKFNTELLLDLRRLSKHADIGIVTGSDIDYINQQMEKLIKYSELRYITHLLPCNGTKYYRPPSQADDAYTLIHSNDMSSELPKDCLREVFKVITNSQADACYYPIPLTGHFINYRGSMINWCPIGRNANTLQREAFVKFDKENGFRESLRRSLETKLELLCPNKLTIKMGGDTSFDIYPRGWDKTYALQHFPDKTVWFVGDRCDPSGNDYELYETLRDKERSFSTSNPMQTGWIIREEIIPKLTHP
jgi:phosphomannomutase